MKLKTRKKLEMEMRKKLEEREEVATQFAKLWKSMCLPYEGFENIKGYFTSEETKAIRNYFESENDQGKNKC